MAINDTKKQILLIEDNEDLRENTAEILELAGYDVLTAENGKTGLALAQEELPDLIVCDILMPELDGYGVLHILARNIKTATIPFIFLTAKADKEDFRRGMNMGADDYITKPFEELDLLNTINRRLQKVSLLNRQFDKKEEHLHHYINVAKADNALQNLTQDYDRELYKAKHLLYLEGSYPKYLYLIQSGKVKTFRSNEDGKELITNLFKEGDFFGYTQLFENLKHKDTAMTLEDSEITLIPKDHFFELVYNDRDVANRFIKMLADSVEEKEEQLMHLAYDSVRKRVADALIQLYEKYAEEKNQERVSLDISREDLSNLVGTSKETLIRTLSDFKQEDLLISKGRYITLTSANIKELKKILG